MTPAAYRRRFRAKNGSGNGSSRAQISSTPPLWPAKAGLNGAPRRSKAEINRQLSALHDKPVISQTYFH
jgi:hypothetical protein